MPLPGDITTITLTGTYLNMLGQPLTGSLTFTPTSLPLTDTTSDVILGAPVVANLNGSGAFSIVLPCTDNADFSLAGWAYTVTETIPGVPTRSYPILLPHTLGSTVDISALAPPGVPSTVTPTIYAILASPLNVFTGKVEAGALGVGATPPGAGVAVIGSSAQGQLVYIEQDGTADHALTVNLVGNSGASQSAINAVSANASFSCVEVTGVEKNRGTVKIAHKGYADGSDASAAGVSIDLQTVSGGSAGTKAQGIFITSTTDSIPGGDAIDVQFNSQDWFVVKGNVGAGNGIVGIGIASGHVPAGMLEIGQKDTSTIGLYMTAQASGADMIQLKDSGGNLRFQINNAGNAIFRANAAFNNPVIIGSVSQDAGGSGSGLTLCHSTDPSTSPATGHVIVYVDGSGNLLARTSAGNVRTIAAV